MSLLHKLFVVSLIVFMSPIYISIGTIILFTSGFPIFFLQRRVGKNGKEFTIFKFRTMIQNAHNLQPSLKKQNQAHGPVFKITEDPRFTPFGRFINHTGLDELPQLFNVLFGTMTLIGPRPLPVNEAKQLEKWQKQREVVLPGIISPWILEGYHNTPFNDWMKSDIEYIAKKSFVYDFKLFVRFLYYWVSLIAKETARTI